MVLSWCVVMAEDMGLGTHRGRFIYAKPACSRAMFSVGVAMLAGTNPDACEIPACAPSSRASRAARGQTRTLSPHASLGVGTGSPNSTPRAVKPHTDRARNVTDQRHTTNSAARPAIRPAGSAFVRRISPIVHTYHTIARLARSTGRSFLRAPLVRRAETACGRTFPALSTDHIHVCAADARRPRPSSLPWTR